LDVLVGARGHEVGEETEAHRALAFVEGGGKGITGEGGGEAMTGGEDVPEPLAAGGGGHHLGYHFLPLPFSEAGGLFLSADGFAIGGGVHQCTV